MIQGEVNLLLQPIVSLEAQDPRGEYHMIHAKLDTGFNGEIGLPRKLFDVLATGPVALQSVTLADGIIRSVRSATVKIKLGSDEINASAFDFGNSNNPLIGMELLIGSAIYIDVVPRGEVRIEQS